MTIIVNNIPYRGPGSNTWKQLQEDKLWGEIRRHALEDDGLRNILDQAIMYYQLLKDNHNNGT